ncbi:MAG: hypothetical protein AAB914_00885 [Patescibacteria group bacterium]
MSRQTRELFVPTAKIIDGVFRESNKTYDSSKINRVALVNRLIYLLGFEYYSTVLEGYASSNLLTISAATRAAIENLADYEFIFKDPDKFNQRAMRYNGRAGLLRKQIESSVGNLDVKAVNTWTSSNISNRVALLGDGLEEKYDHLSYFVHPSPASIEYTNQESFMTSQVNNTIELAGYVTLRLINEMHRTTSFKCVEKKEIVRIIKIYQKLNKSRDISK